MPYYTFKHPKKEVYRDVFFRMNDTKSYSEKDVAFERVFSVPQATICTKIDPWCSKSFIEKTSNKGTLGDLFDRAKELGLKRAEQNGGVDPLAKASKEKRDKDILNARLKNREAISKYNAKIKKDKKKKDLH